PGRDINLSEKRVEGGRNFATKLWNAARYAEMNGCRFVEDFDPRSCQRKENRWIAGATRDCAMAVAAALEAFRFDEAAHLLYHFVWGTFCDWYLEFTKPILTGDDAAARRETQAATAWTLAQLLRLLHPLMPFVTEELWRELGGAGLLISKPWPGLPPDLHDPAAAAEMEPLIQDISAIRAVRAELNVPPGTSIRANLFDPEPAAERRVRSNSTHYERLARVQFVDASDHDETSVSVAGTQITFQLHLRGVVDIAKEKARLAKEIGRLDADLKKFAQKLANPDFLAKAKPEIIAEQREREADVRRERDRLQTAYARIAAG
ncbi:MAG TPA: class I tRNA ligase family protein, partial [Stellaceae bacterium]|nr:class I tRNA ligase family protein [Stellaceae bacterium]